MSHPIGSRTAGAIAMTAAVGSILLAFWLLGTAALVAAITLGVLPMRGISWQEAAFMYGHSARWVILLVGWTGSAALLAMIARRLDRPGAGESSRGSLSGAATRLASIGLAGAAADAALVAVLMIYARWYALAWL